MTTTETTTTPYPTIDDKIALFKQHGIDASDYYGRNDPLPNVQMLRFEGNRATADLALAIATLNSIGVLSLSHSQDYDSDNNNVPWGDPYWEILFD